MAEEPLGVVAAVAIALGAMIGGGIYAVLGVVASLTGSATWFAFTVAGLVALCTGYSFVALNGIAREQDGGAVSFVERFLGNSTLAGMIGWTLLVGYIGSMSMYAFAFGEFGVEILGVESVAGLALRPTISVLALAGFVGLNLLGASATGSAEDLLVGTKVLGLGAFGVGGIVYLLGWSPSSVHLGLSQLTGTGPLIAAAVSFVAFQGWQLLFYDQERLKDPVRTIRRAVYLAIPAAIGIYAVVGITTVNLAPEAIASTPNTALARAAETALSPLGAGRIGAVAIAVSALFSTGSALNATLFSTGYFAKNLVADDLLPDRVGDASAAGIPVRTLLGIGAITAGLSVAGTLGAITAFSSLAFILVFGSLNLLALREAVRDTVNPIPPAVGAVGGLSFFPLMVYHLVRAERRTLYGVLVLAGVVLAVEVLYFERDWLRAEVTV